MSAQTVSASTTTYSWYDDFSSANYTFYDANIASGGNCYITGGAYLQFGTDSQFSTWIFNASNIIFNSSLVSLNATANLKVKSSSGGYYPVYDFGFTNQTTVNNPEGYSNFLGFQHNITSGTVSDTRIIYIHGGITEVLYDGGAFSNDQYYTVSLYLENNNNFSYYLNGALLYNNASMNLAPFVGTFSVVSSFNGKIVGGSYYIYEYTNWFNLTKVTTDPITNYTLTVNAPTHGAINQSSGSFNDGTVLGLLATANSHYHFLNWIIDGSNSTTNPTSATMTANHTVDAYFEIDNYTLTVNAPSNGAINQSSGVFNYNSFIGLLATPDPTYEFLNWIIDGANSTDNPTNVTMSADHTVSAYFVLSATPQYYLDVGANFHGTMNISSGWYDENTIVNIEATPDPHYAFLNWIIDSVNETDNPLEIMMDQNHTIDAYYEVSEYYLTISALAHGSLNTTSGYYPVGEMVFIEGYGAAHYALEYFNVDGTNQSWLDWDINVTMDGDHTVGAYFTIIIRGLTVYDPAGGAINTTSGAYDDGTTIYVLATPSANYTFSHWYTDYYPNSTDNPYELLIESNIDLYAYFDPYPVIETDLAIIPNNYTLYLNQTLDFSSQLLMVNGTPLENCLIRIMLNGSVIFFNQTDSLGWVNGSYNITALSVGNYTLTAQFDEMVNNTGYYIASGNTTTAAQLIEILAIPAAPAPAPVKHTNSVGQLGTVVIILAAIMIYSAAKGKNGRHPIKIRS